MLALVSDLFFADRIIRIGQTVNEDVHVYHSQEEFKSAVMKDHPSVAIVELPLLDDSDLTWIAKIPHVAGYGPHVAELAKPNHVSPEHSIPRHIRRR